MLVFYPKVIDGILAFVTITIRTVNEADYDSIWNIFRHVVAHGDAFAFSPDTTKSQAFRLWLATPLATYVACEEGRVLGTYFIQPNQPGLGDHVCNCGYMVAPTSRGRGVATQMCLHSQQEAIRLGFRAMQFNFVVSTNVSAVHLWKRLGFDIVGTLPKAFRHLEQGLTDVFVMYKTL